VAIYTKDGKRIRITEATARNWIVRAVYDEPTDPKDGKRAFTDQVANFSSTADFYADGGLEEIEAACMAKVQPAAKFRGAG
jgi:hypothetical protein